MNFAILGCAHMHIQSYLGALKELKINIAGVYDKNKDLLLEFCKKNDLKPYEDIDELLNCNIDAVIICSENNLHKAYTIKACEKKCHVLVEKPIATTIDDANEMIECCKNNNVKLMVCFPVRFSTPIVQLKKAINEIGDIRSIVATNHGSMPGSWFIHKELSGGGSVMDHTVHVADIIHWILNSKVKSVNAVMDTLFHDIDIEDSGLLLIEFENGVIASIDTSWNRPKSFPCWGDLAMDFHGTKGSIRVDAFLERGNMYRDEANKSLYYDFGNDMDFELVKEFINAIKEDRPPKITGEDGLYALEIALMAYDFAKN